jgi:hypothetical protein
MTRRSDASNERVISLFDFTGKDCPMSAINRGELRGFSNLFHWLFWILGTDPICQQQPSSKPNSNRHAQLISRLDCRWLGGSVGLG